MDYFIASPDGRLSLKQQDIFTQLGFLVLKDYISPSEIQTLQQRIIGIIHDTREYLLTLAINEYNRITIPPLSFFFEHHALNTQKQLLYPLEQALSKISPLLHRKDSVFHHFSYQNKIKATLGDLGYLKPLLVQSMYHFKQPQIGSAVDGHQDATFIHSYPKPVVGLWFALEDTNQSNGCLWAIPGKHSFPLRNKFLRQENGQLQFEFYDQEPWLAQDAVPIEVSAGSLVILHGHLPHGSFVNHSFQSRHAYTLHAIDALGEYPKTNWLPLKGGTFF